MDINDSNITDVLDLVLKARLLYSELSEIREKLDAYHVRLVITNKSASVDHYIDQHMIAARCSL